MGAGLIQWTQCFVVFPRANHRVRAQDLGRRFNRVDKMNLTLTQEMIVTRELSQIHALVLKRIVKWAGGRISVWEDNPSQRSHLTALRGSQVDLCIYQYVFDNTASNKGPVGGNN